MINRDFKVNLNYKSWLPLRGLGTDCHIKSQFPYRVCEAEKVSSSALRENLRKRYKKLSGE